MIRGGLRSRLILDSMVAMLEAGLEARGWLDATVYDTPPGVRTHHPVRFLPGPVAWDVELVPNVVTVNIEDVADEDRGFGGDVEDRLLCYADVYAEDDAVGLGLAFDVRDLLTGTIVHGDPQGPILSVKDFRTGGDEFTVVDVEAVTVDRATGYQRAWQQHWFMVRCTLVDEYHDE